MSVGIRTAILPEDVLRKPQRAHGVSLHPRIDVAHQHPGTSSDIKRKRTRVGLTIDQEVPGVVIAHVEGGRSAAVVEICIDLTQNQQGFFIKSARHTAVSMRGG